MKTTSDHEYSVLALSFRRGTPNTRVREASALAEDAAILIDFTCEAILCFQIK
jgi:hypothetical protein